VVVVETYVVRLWLPDRPGALGQVAGHIGAAEGDVTGIEILERGGGNAIDELTVTLPRAGMVDRLIEEIRRVDGVAVEDVRRVPDDRPDAAMAALSMAARLVGCDPFHRLRMFCIGLRDLVDGDWAVVLGGDSVVPLASCGTIPDIGWISAFVHGSRHLHKPNESTPSDIVWTHIDELRATAIAGRSGRPFHARERQQVELLGQVVGGSAAFADRLR
jgi:hypothetical protein